jgi:UDP-glucose 4-epimerase
MAILVTGGAGYIGSVTVEMLRAHGSRVVVLDNLSTGHAEAVAPEVPFYKGSVGNASLVNEIVNSHEIDSCIHFAASAYVGESISNPSKYFENNTIETNFLLRALIDNNVKKFVFSSTCATYGDPIQIPIDETHPQKPVNPYGWSKFMSERIMECYDAAYGLRYAALRYFNAAGASPNRGEHHDPETHLIPIVLAAAAGELPCVPVFGEDYATPDGTCIRDYVHVTDLGAAHIKALENLGEGDTSFSVNLGSGVGFSVLDVVETARRITGRTIDVKIEPRRTGDPSHLVADASKASALLGFEAMNSGIDTIIQTAWEWKMKHPTGYDESDSHQSTSTA